MNRLPRILLLCGLVLTGCASPSPTPAPATPRARLPTRRPTAAPTATPIVLPADVYYQQGLERQRAGDLNTARRHFTWAIQRDATFAPAYISRGFLHLARGDEQEALRDADAALAIEPAARAYVLRGDVFRALERYPQAWEAFDRALERDPSLADDLFQSRWTLARAADDQERLQALAEGYAAAHPDDWLRHYYLAWVHLHSQRYDEAIAVLVAGMDEAAAQPVLFWYLLGRAYIGIEAWDEAVLSLETARDLMQVDDTSMLAHTEQPSGELFVALGKAYLGAGRCADAEAMLAYGISQGAPMSEHLPALEEARSCQDATP